MRYLNCALLLFIIFFLALWIRHFDIRMDTLEEKFKITINNQAMVNRNIARTWKQNNIVMKTIPETELRAATHAANMEETYRRFSLKPNSPAIDAGTDVGLSEDFAGTPVPSGRGVDIGAAEYRIEPPENLKAE